MEDFPLLLGELADQSHSEPSSALWDALHHQGDVDLGSYAALPYLLDTAERLPAAERSGFLGLASTILALSEADHNPDVPDDMQAQVISDRERLGRLALEALAALPATDEETLGILLGSISISRGQTRMGNVFLDWTAEYSCPECGAVITPLGYDL